jgi:hypothetical protein
MGVVSDFEKELLQKSPAKFASWHAIDLHNHSPSSRDYRGEAAKSVELSAEAIIKSDLSVVMFTDHEKFPLKEFVSEVAKKSKRLILQGWN